MPQPSRRRQSVSSASAESALVEVVAMLLVDSSRLELVAAAGGTPVLPWMVMGADARHRYRDDARLLLSQINTGTPEYHRELVTVFGRERQEAPA